MLNYYLSQRCKLRLDAPTAPISAPSLTREMFLITDFLDKNIANNSEQSNTASCRREFEKRKAEWEAS